MGLGFRAYGGLEIFEGADHGGCLVWDVSTIGGFVA